MFCFAPMRGARYFGCCKVNNDPSWYGQAQMKELIWGKSNRCVVKLTLTTQTLLLFGLRAARREEVGVCLSGYASHDGRLVSALK